MIGFQVFILTLIAMSSAGCTVVPVYRLTRTSPHKDVLRCVVYMKERAEPEVYRRIALQEVDRIRSEGGSRKFPLYEVTFEFLGGSSQRLAKVLVFPADEPQTPAEVVKAPPPRIETILY